MHPVIRRLLEEDHDIRLVAMNWPILGPVSLTAARVALAANWQARFAAADDALFTVPGRLDEAKVRDAAASAGVDMARLDRDMAQRASAMEDALGDVALNAASLGLQGTPGFLIGSSLVRGALSYDDLRSLVEKARGARQPS
jgi:protein-disulfide isomerase